VLVRSEIADPDHELRAGMFAAFTITIGRPKRALAVPQDGVVREGDGTMTVWVTAGRHKYTKRVVKTGLSHQGFVEIRDGLKEENLVATDGSLLMPTQYPNAN